MKKFALYILIASFSVLLSECTNKVYKENSYYNLTNNKLDSKESFASQEEQENIMIQQENNKAWEEAHKLRASLTDSDFLKTKRPMCDDAIGPYNYHTGLVEDRASGTFLLNI